jgi:hypothetical protein
VGAGGTALARFTRSMIRLIAVAALPFGLAACSTLTSGRGSYAQTYYVASHNWAFRHTYPDADRLLNAFDFGHATLHASLLHGATGEQLDGPVFSRVTGVLRAPPSVPLADEAIAPDFAKLVPEIAAIFDWAHMLHRQLYDVLSDSRIEPQAQAARVRELLVYYSSRPDLALSRHPKSMSLMDGQPYSLTFRRAAPRYNGLVWSYHWLQMVVYDDLLGSSARATRAAAIDAAVAHFWTMVEDAGAAPTVMPMSAAIAPLFAERYPEAAIIFDNLHALHDVISDILSVDTLPPRATRRLAMEAASRYRDSTTSVISHDEWQVMSRAMGLDHMGGAAPANGQRVRPAP